MNRPTTFVTLALPLVFLTSACGQKAGAPPSPAAEASHESEAATERLPESVTLTSAAIAEAGIDTWTVKPVNLEHLLVLSGSVTANQNRLLSVAAQVRGRVVALPVDLGAVVAAGAPVAVIESVDLANAQEAFIRGLSDLRASARSYERAKALVGGKAISAGEFHSREGDYLGKREAVDAAERSLRLIGEPGEEIDRIRAAFDSGEPVRFPHGVRLNISAPFSGRVIERKVTPGAVFEALQPLVTIADLSSVWVQLQAYEKDLALLRSGVGVSIRTDAYPEKAFKGRIDFLGSLVDPATRTIELRATVPNPGEKLRPGMFVKAQVDVPQAYEGKTVVAIPQSALQTMEGRTVVFVRTAAGVFLRRLVETGHTFEGFTEVYSGIKTGDVVVTEGSFILKSEFAKASLGEEK